MEEWRMVGEAVNVKIETAAASLEDGREKN